MSRPSSEDLHPSHGGRFVLVRRGDAAPPVYAVDVYLPQGRHLQSTLRWTEQGHAQLDPPLSDTWAQQETLKLARVLHKNPKPRLTRWRG